MGSGDHVVLIIDSASIGIFLLESHLLIGILLLESLIEGPPTPGLQLLEPMP